ncbi:hypothetical protein GCM10011496_00780 [Polaromonas eurypsychrophila]|uniref:Uncharacterized protein n=1 Tax=Polaromonas eurypsychrophila TaxID=1614635 RepID=A0A916S4H9_9BURK|nr:hypothetical protein GCM10011496_00780 [Polaromonas eurypsychrophila]
MRMTLGWACTADALKQRASTATDETVSWRAVRKGKKEKEFVFMAPIVQTTGGGVTVAFPRRLDAGSPAWRRR